MLRRRGLVFGTIVVVSTMGCGSSTSQGPADPSWSYVAWVEAGAPNAERSPVAIDGDAGSSPSLMQTQCPRGPRRLDGGALPLADLHLDDAGTSATEAGVAGLPEALDHPKQLSDRPPSHRLESARARVRGRVFARCVLMPTGDLADCCIIRGSSYLDEEVLSGLRKSKFVPVRWRGQFVAVDVVIPIEIVPPEPPKPP